MSHHPSVKHEAVHQSTSLVWQINMHPL